MCRGGTANIYWLKDAQDGVTWQEAKRKNKEEIHGCGERGYVDSWCEKLSYRGQGKMKGEKDDSLWRLLEKAKPKEEKYI